MQNKIIMVLGTGGTIAGRAASSQDNTGYVAGQIEVADLVAAIPVLGTLPLAFEQVAQLDSKDMDHLTWQRLAQRTALHLARPEVTAVVITHGTDTLEETAFFLQQVLNPAKPVVMTAAMRPATSLQADGPQNLVDAMVVAQTPGARGVSVVMAGRVHGPDDVRKAQAYRLDAFSSGERGPLALIEEGHLRQLRSWPLPNELPDDWASIQGDPADWPRVELVTSHAGSDGALVHALLQTGVRGLVVAGCGNGNLHCGLQAACAAAQAQGVTVWLSSRCADGSVIEPQRDGSADVGAAGADLKRVVTDLSPVKARIRLLLNLLGERPGAV